MAEEEDNEKSPKKIIHLERNGIHEYFSSPGALYQKYSVDELGISQGALINYFYKCAISNQKCEYKNHKCIIRKGILHKRRGK